MKMTSSVYCSRVCCTIEVKAPRPRAMMKKKRSIKCETESHVRPQYKLFQIEFWFILNWEFMFYMLLLWHGTPKQFSFFFATNWCGGRTVSGERVRERDPNERMGLNRTIFIIFLISSEVDMVLYVGLYLSLSLFSLSLSLFFALYLFVFACTKLSFTVIWFHLEITNRNKPKKTTWRREGGRDIVLRSEGRDKQCKYATFYLLS